MGNSQLTFDPATLDGLKVVGGLYVSFLSEGGSDAVASLTVMAFPTLEVSQRVSICYARKVSDSADI